jgi:hypothetical protein
MHAKVTYLFSRYVTAEALLASIHAIGCVVISYVLLQLPKIMIS